MNGQAPTNNNPPYLEPLPPEIIIPEGDTLDYEPLTLQHLRELWDSHRANCVNCQHIMNEQNNTAIPDDYVELQLLTDAEYEYLHNNVILDSETDRALQWVNCPPRRPHETDAQYTQRCVRMYRRRRISVQRNNLSEGGRRAAEHRARRQTTLRTGAPIPESVSASIPIPEPIPEPIPATGAPRNMDKIPIIADEFIPFVHRNDGIVDNTMHSFMCYTPMFISPYHGTLYPDELIPFMLLPESPACRNIGTGSRRSELFEMMFSYTNRPIFHRMTHWTALLNCVYSTTYQWVTDDNREHLAQRDDTIIVPAQRLVVATQHIHVGEFAVQLVIPSSLTSLRNAGTRYPLINQMMATPTSKVWLSVINHLFPQNVVTQKQFKEAIPVTNTQPCTQRTALLRLLRKKMIDETSENMSILLSVFAKTTFKIPTPGMI